MPVVHVGAVDDDAVDGRDAVLEPLGELHLVLEDRRHPATIGDPLLAREQARKDLPLSTYTEAYWKVNLHNLLHFLELRMDEHAQWEIRQYALTIGHQISEGLRAHMGLDKNEARERAIELLEMVDRPKTLGFQADMAHTLLYTMGYNAPEHALLQEGYSDDEFWAARNVMAFTDDDIAAVVSAGEYTEARAEEWITRCLIERRDRIGQFFEVRHVLHALGRSGERGVQGALQLGRGQVGAGEVGPGEVGAGEQNGLDALEGRDGGDDRYVRGQVAHREGHVGVHRVA